MKSQPEKQVIPDVINPNRRFQMEYDQVEVQFAVKGLMILNGGGSIALLAFLGQTWDIEPTLRTPVVLGIGLVTLGIVFTVTSAHLRTRAMHSHLNNLRKEHLPEDSKERIILEGELNKENYCWRKYMYSTSVYIPIRSVSLLCFCTAIAQLLYTVIKM